MYVLCGVVCIAVFQANGIMRQKSKRSRAAAAAAATAATAATAAVALLGVVVVVCFAKKQHCYYKPEHIQPCSL